MKKRVSINRLMLLVITLTITFTIVFPFKTDAKTPFTDIKGNDHYNAIVTLYESGIIFGRTSQEYKPSATITRGETAQFIVNALGINNEEAKNPGYKDVSTSHPYYKAIAILTKRGVVGGYGNGKYGPNDSLTRSQAATMITKAFELKASRATKTKFTDVNKLTDPNAISYIQTLVDYGITVGTTKTTFSPWMKLTRGHLATFLYRAIEIDALEVVGIE